MKTFRDLVKLHARKGLKPTQRPKTLATVADEFGMHVSTLKSYMSGRRGADPADWLVASIAKATNLSARRVRELISASRK